MSPEERDYYRERALVERQLTSVSMNPQVREIHEKLASLYDGLVDLNDQPEGRPKKTASY